MSNESKMVFEVTQHIPNFVGGVKPKKCVVRHLRELRDVPWIQGKIITVHRETRPRLRGWLFLNETDRHGVWCLAKIKRRRS